MLSRLAGPFRAVLLQRDVYGNCNARDEWGWALVETMLASRGGVCFANLGTSEMHFVAALGAAPETDGPFLIKAVI